MKNEGSAARKRTLPGSRGITQTVNDEMEAEVDEAAVERPHE
ncbi:hypothetical protein X771_30545 [Mesorhizobium sp. LSJC277A00]|nr:hypothetical protein X771_30545 [Mesorhizobium sp. LSJC277A00]ESX26568.1 hypothetical protein X767_04600 [Mesorhizobium sp. LSJC264A00]